MIRIEHDPAFWVGVASHPALAHMLHGAEPEAIAALLPRAVPIASEHGGMLFLRADSAGLAYEMHTLFTPEGWGREAFQTLRDGLEHILGTAQLVMTHETAHPQSKPPRTFRFQPLGPAPITDGQHRLWILTRDAWLASPARRR